MAQITLPGSPPINVILRKSARAKRLSLRVSQLDGRVTLTLPKRVSETQGRAFAMEKQDWLRKHLDQRPQTIRIDNNAILPIEGRLRQITGHNARSATLTDDALLLPGDPEQFARRAEVFLKHMARDRLAAASDSYAAKLGKPYSRITLRDTRSRWGSCSSAGALMYSWRLILAPPHVLEYVAAHEVAHLQHMDHSPAFWDQVASLYGDYSCARAWLRTEGLDLHRYSFA